MLRVPHRGYRNRLKNVGLMISYALQAIREKAGGMPKGTECQRGHVVGIDLSNLKKQLPFPG